MKKVNKQEKVILLQDTHWGKKNETKEFKRGFVINYLLPEKKALLVNKNNLLWLEKQRAKREQENLMLEEKAQEIYGKINNFTLSFTLNKDEKNIPFGSVGFKEILQELEKKGFYLEKSQLTDFHSFNKLGENMLKVKLSNNLTADLKIIIK